MITISNNLVTRLAEGDWVVDICRSDEDASVLEAWLYCADIGVKSFMFACEPRDLDEFIDLVEMNVENYKEEYEEMAYSDIPLF